MGFVLTLWIYGGIVLAACAAAYWPSVD